ncbi:hypothetical protein L7F22_040596 [Adiantum nelumboides]|nr:hypothetical protein [Adiantum nelumboides]
MADLGDFMSVATDEHIIHALKEGLQEAKVICDLLGMQYEFWLHEGWEETDLSDLFNARRFLWWEETDLSDLFDASVLPKFLKEDEKEDDPLEMTEDIIGMSASIHDEVCVAECELRHVIDTVIDEEKKVTSVISPFVELDGKKICKSTLVSQLSGNPTLSKDRLQGFALFYNWSGSGLDQDFRFVTGSGLDTETAVTRSGLVSLWFLDYCDSFATGSLVQDLKLFRFLVSFLETAVQIWTGSITITGLWLVLDYCSLVSSVSGSGLVQISVTSLDNTSGSGFGLVSSVSGQTLWSDSSSGFGPLAGTQGSATQDPHIAASDSSFDFDVMEGYPIQQHPESSSQDMHALGQQPGVSMFSRLKETLSRATRSEHATNEINEGGGEVDSPFTSQIDPVLSESVHVSTPATTPIGLSKLTPSETLLPDGRSLVEVQEVERYILAAREKEIESLRKVEQRRATLEKSPMTSANPLQSPELTTLKSQPIGSSIASGSKDTPNASILDGVFLNANWEYNLQTEKLTDLYTSYTYDVGWLDVIQATSNSTSVDEQQWMICDVIHSIVQIERQNLGINMPSMGSMRFLNTTKAKQPTISQMETPLVSPMDPSYIVSPGVSMQSEPTHGSFSFPDLVQPSLGDLPTPPMNMTRDMATLIASSTNSIEERYPFSLSQLCSLCYPVISLEWDHIEQLARKKNLDELKWLIRLLTTSDRYPVEDMHPIAQIYPLAQVDYTRLVRFLVLLCEEDDEDIEDDWTDMSHGMTDNDFIYLDDTDRDLALGLSPNLYNILFP